MKKKEILKKTEKVVKAKKIVEITIPEKEPVNTLFISKILLLLGDNLYEKLPNITKFNPLDFTSWTTFERYFKTQYNIGIIDELYIRPDGTFTTLPRANKKIGYILVEKSDAFNYVGGGHRLTSVMSKNVRFKVDVELSLVNSQILKLEESLV